MSWFPIIFGDNGTPATPQFMSLDGAWQYAKSKLTPLGKLLWLPVSAPAKTYATFDPSYKGSGVTLSNGNLTYAYSGAAYQSTYLNIGKNAGQWAMELTISGAAGSTIGLFGIADTRTLGTYIGNFINSIGCFYDGTKYSNSSPTSGYWKAPGLNPTSLLILFDCNSRTLVFSDPVSGFKASNVLPGSGTIYFGVCAAAGSSPITVTVNTGQTTFVHDSSVPTGYNKGIWQ